MYICFRKVGSHRIVNEQLCVRHKEMFNHSFCLNTKWSNPETAAPCTTDYLQFDTQYNATLRPIHTETENMNIYYENIVTPILHESPNFAVDK